MATPPFENTRVAQHEKLDQAKQVELFDAITRNFEDLYSQFQTQQAAIESGNSFLRLASKGEHKIAFGNSAVVFTASTLSASLTVTHGLGAAPKTIVATALLSPSAGKIPLFNTTGTSKTAFTINAEIKEAFTGGIAFYWVAIA